MKKILFFMFLFLSAAAQAQTPTMGLKNFREFYYSLIATTGVTPTPEMKTYYASVMNRLPKDGRVGEMSATVSSTEKSVAGLFCKEFSKTYKPSSDTDSMLQDLSDRFYQRPLSVNEAKILTGLLSKMSPQTNKAFVVCTAMTGSVEFSVKK